MNNMIMWLQQFESRSLFINTSIYPLISAQRSNKSAVGDQHLAFNHCNEKFAYLCSLAHEMSDLVIVQWAHTTVVTSNEFCFIYLNYALGNKFPPNDIELIWMFSWFSDLCTFCRWEIIDRAPKRIILLIEESMLQRIPSDKISGR